MKDPLFHHDHGISTRQERRVVQGRYASAEAALYILAAPTLEDLEETKSLEILVALRRLNPRHVATHHCFRRDTNRLFVASWFSYQRYVLLSGFILRKSINLNIIYAVGRLDKLFSMETLARIHILAFIN